MISLAGTIRLRRARYVAIPLCGTVLYIVAASLANATGCMFEPQGEGRVSAIVDARTFRLQDGREVRLAGIEPAATAKDKTNGKAALEALLTNREVRLHGEDDTPDRYGRQPAFVFVDQSEAPVQSLLLAQGEALVSATVADRDCASSLTAAEAEARQCKARNLGQFRCHKKRGKSGRYFGQDRAVYCGGGEGLVGSAGGGDDLHQFRTTLDTRLCCDYFKAGDANLRGYRNLP